MEMDMVQITAEEYRELVIKAYAYDKLREICLSSSYATTAEEILFDITDEEKAMIEERRNK